MPRVSNPWKFSTFFLLIVMGLLVCLGFDRPDNSTKTVEAQEFVLKDNSGKVRARIAMENNQPKMLFYDKTGRTIWNAPNTGMTLLK